MFKKAILFLGLAAGLTPFANAQQKCATDEVLWKLKQRNPQIAIDEAALEQAIKSGLLNMIPGTAAKGSGTNRPDTTTIYHIPIVFHIIHDYGAEYVPDNTIYDEVAYINRTYSRTNVSELVGLVPPFNGNIPGTGVRYAGNARIQFHLATIDPSGNPTNGITRRYSYLTGLGGDEAKFDIWPTNRYMNVWIINRFSASHASAAAYAYPPFSAQQFPYGDGPIGLYNYLGRDNTFAHELGHELNLQHVWGSTNQPEVECGDDGVDDTPPTKGHLVDNRIGGCTYPDANPNADINDTSCSKGYVKVYTPTQFDVLYGDSIARTIDYPDTNNSQNIMDYTYCSKMFTYGQVVRMRASLNSSIAGRNNLWTADNLNRTGALAPRPDLAPIADFSVNRNFFCANTVISTNTITYTDRSWRDTIASRAWTFSNATPATGNAASQTITNVSQPGWVTTTLTANSNAGSNSITRSDLVYAADPNAISPNGYYQEFNQGSGSDVDQYPIFNYYGLSAYRWELKNNRGYSDNSCIMFRNYDPRQYATDVTMTQSPGGNYADFYTRAFDLSGSEFASKCYLTFFSAGAYRVVNPIYMNDTLQISYSVDCGNIWRPLGNLTRSNLANNGFVSVAYEPLGSQEWKLNSMSIPSLGKTGRVFFRFRFKSGTDNGEQTGYPWGTGNNFYLDRINITSNSVGVNEAELAAKGMTLSPNPTTGAATVTIHGGDNSVAQINVTDVTGKLVYRTEVRLSNNVNQYEIPAEQIAVKGMYMVHVIANGKAQTQKLVVY